MPLLLPKLSAQQNLIHFLCPVLTHATTLSQKNEPSYPFMLTGGLTDGQVVSTSLYVVSHYVV